MGKGRKGSSIAGKLKGSKGPCYNASQQIIACKSKKLSTLVIALIAGGAALLILIAGVVAFTVWLCRRRRNRSKKPSEPETVFVHGQDQNKPFMLTTLNTHSPYQPQYFHSSETPQTNSYQQYAPYVLYSDGKSTVTPDPHNGYGYGYYGNQQQEYMAPPDQRTQYNTGAQYDPPPGPPTRH